jgi:ACT domain-containing protein
MPDSKKQEQLLREIAILAKEHLGDQATPERVEAIVKAVAEKLTIFSPTERPATQNRELDTSQETTGRIIVSAFGKNRPGIVAEITNVLAKHNCDIQDISQKLMQEFFTMILVVDITEATSQFNQIKSELQSCGNQIGARIFVQHEDVFRFTNRI